VLENALLRQQSIIIERQKKRPVLTRHDPVMLAPLVSKLQRWNEPIET